MGEEWYTFQIDSRGVVKAQVGRGPVRDLLNPNQMGALLGLTDRDPPIQLYKHPGECYPTRPPAASLRQPKPNLRASLRTAATGSYLASDPYLQILFREMPL